MFVALMGWGTATVEAHHRDGHDKGGGRGGGEETQTASIDLLNCDDDDGTIAKWSSTNVTFQIVDVSGVGSDVIDAVRQGVLRWNSVQTTYSLQEVTTGTANITVSLFFKMVPGYILGSAHVDCHGGDEIESVNIMLGVKGLRLTGVGNVSSHEIGHGLGLGHADKTGDLMDPRFERKEESKRVVCPSNLDVDGLTSTVDPYNIPIADWQEPDTCWVVTN